MDNMVGCFGGLIALAALAGGAGFAFLLITSQAVLVSEQKQADNYFGRYRCSYFTGTQTVTLYDNSETGCTRLVTVGSR